MAEFFDFGTYTVDADLDTQGWTDIWGSGGSYIVRSSAEAEYGGNVVEVSSTTENRQAIIPDASPTNETLFDVIARVRTTTTGSQWHFRMGLKLSGSAGAESTAVTPLYNNSGTTTYISAVKYVDGAGSVGSATDQGTDFSNTWVYVRTKTFADGTVKGVFDTTLSQIYDADDPTADPAIGWTVSYAADDVSAGSVGIQTQQTDYVTELDWFGVGYGGEAAPVAPTATGIELSLVSKTNNSVEISWTDDATWDTYQIERDAVVIDTVPGTQFSYTDSGLTSSTAFDYRVRGYRTT